MHFYYSNRWQILETRNGSGQATRQWVWGTRYVDEVLFMDVNADPQADYNCNPDVSDAGQGQDRRYFYHQDRNWNVVALTEYDDGVGTNARVVERYAYTPYGEFVVTTGDAGSGELGGPAVRRRENLEGSRPGYSRFGARAARLSGPVRAPDVCSWSACAGGGDARAGRRCSRPARDRGRRRPHRLLDTHKE